MSWEPYIPNALPAEPEAGSTAEEPSAGVVRCSICGHPFSTHFATAGDGGGCAATEPPATTLEAAVRRAVPKPFVGSVSCLCPGWIRGQIPHAITKHLTRLTDDEDAACSLCEHPLHDHSEEQGCHMCPCTVHALPQAIRRS